MSNLLAIITGDYAQTNETIYVHLLVLNYFKNESDKVALEFFGERGVIGHHIRAIAIPVELKGKGHTEEKIKRCMMDSCKANLVYQGKFDHVDDSRMAHGGTTADEQHGKSEWSQELQELRESFYLGGKLQGNSFGTYYKYLKDEHGNLVREIVLHYDVKGSINHANDVIWGEYKVNADVNQDFLLEHQDEILERIEQDKPKKKSYEKGIILENVSIVYALA